MYLPSKHALLAVSLVVAVLAIPGAAVGRDTDGDGLRDAFERRSGVSSPLVADTDGDGVVDSAEDEDGDDLGALGEQRFGTDPSSADSDGDGIPDGREDHDGDGRPNALQQHARRVPPDLRPSLQRAADDISRHAPRCGVRAGEAAPNRCHFGDLASETTVVLLGDSKATMYLPPAIAAARAEGWHLVTLLKGRCTPVLGAVPRYQRLLDDGATCRGWRRAAFEYLRQDPPELIVMVFSDDYTLVDRRNRKLKGERELNALRQGMAATMAELPAESTVVLLADAPKSTVNPVACLKRDASDMSACLTPRAPAISRRVEATLKAAVMEAGGTYRTLEDRICPYKPCPLVQGDVLVYRDQGHLTVTFTRQLAPSLQAELAPLVAQGHDAAAAGEASPSPGPRLDLDPIPSASPPPPAEASPGPATAIDAA
jgi:hypothetical protein